MSAKLILEGCVLLIHAGGFSKRLPNVSVIGKIFAVVPLGKFRVILCNIADIDRFLN